GNWPVKCLGITYSWVSEKDEGQSDAINKGFRQAKGDYVAWLNSDDTYLPGAFKKVIEYFSKHRDVTMVYGEGYHITEQGDIIERYPTEPFDPERLGETCFICQPAVFMQRSVLDEVGYLDYGLNYCMDYEYWIRIAMKELKIGFIPEYLANSRMYNENKTKSKRVEVHYEIIKTVKKHFGYVPEIWINTYIILHLERWTSRDTWLNNFIYLRLRKLFYRYMMLRFNYNTGKNAGLK
ncbi:MAG: glycosyltransferase, partial [Deltaproteobacteria bacterium]|nr:glycosyltransferase [Deltaproteobacteria bacterium]